MAYTHHLEKHCYQLISTDTKGVLSITIPVLNSSGKNMYTVCEMKKRCIIPRAVLRVCVREVLTIHSN